MKRGIIIAAFFCFTLTNLVAAEPLQVKLNSYSLWVAPALYRPSAGVNYRNFFSSKDEVTPANNEMALVEHAFPEVRAGIMFYQSPSLVFILRYNIDLPAIDANNNGILDIFEYSQAVSAVTHGVYYDAEHDEEGTFSITWNKAPEAYDGTFNLRYDFATFNFFHVFQCFEYNALWNPTRTAGRTSGNINLTRNGIEDLILRGPLNIDVTEAGVATVAGATWFDEFNTEWIFTTEGPGRVENGKFVQDIVVADGLPQIGPLDFYHWRLTITDPNDSDSDNLPDLIDPTPTGGGGGTPPIRPTLRIALTANGVQITIEGEAGRTYILERASDPAATVWGNPQNVTSTAANTVVEIARPATSTFWRARVQQ